VGYREGESGREITIGPADERNAGGRRERDKEKEER
jgi:hypothetical protein